MVAGSKGNKTSIIFDKIDFKEYYKQNFPKIFNARERRMYQLTLVHDNDITNCKNCQMKII